MDYFCQFDIKLIMMNCEGWVRGGEGSAGRVGVVVVRSTAASLVIGVVVVTVVRVVVVNSQYEQSVR